jgi:hypothetical protein
MKLTIPTRREVNVLVQTQDPPVFGSLDSEIQSVGRTWAVFDQDHFVGRVRLKARGREEIGVKNLSV